MNLTEKFLRTRRTIRLVFSKRKYFFISLVSGTIIFLVLLYFMVRNVADRSLRIYLDMSGSFYTIESLISMLVISSLFGIYLSLVVFKISAVKSAGKSGFLGIFGGGIGALGIGCPTCGAFLFGLFGAPLALMSFPFRGAEIRIFSIVVLMLSIYLISKSINKSCNLKQNL